MDNEESKLCKKCERELPLTKKYFHKDKYTEDGFTTQCKECRTGKEIFNKVKPKDGFKFCKKCSRELEISPRFFPIDKSCKDGHRNVCRECGKDGHFMEEGYIPKEWWTKEEEKLLIEIYPHYLNEEIIELYFPSETLHGLQDKGNKLGLHKTDETMKRKHKLHSERIKGENAPNYGKTFSEEHRRKISEARKGKYVGENSYWFGKKRSIEQRILMSRIVKERGQWKGENNPRHINPLNGELNGRWEGGKTKKNFKIRNSKEYSEWRNSVFARDNYTCQCCGTKRDRIQAHHIENFSKHENKRFDIDNGITLCKECHDPTIKGSFHYSFGTRNNNLEQLHQYIIGVSWDLETRIIYENYEEAM